jgi:hypothetical protein
MMRFYPRGTLAIIAIFVLIAAAKQAVYAQNKERSPLEARVQKIEIHQGTLLDGLAQLSEIPESLSFSFEEILKNRATDPAPPQAHFDLNLQGVTVRAALDALCSRDPRYTWSVDRTMINVFPRKVQNDGAYLMNRNIARLEIKEPSNAGEATFSIVAQLSPPFEQIAYAQAGGDISYPQPWHITIENVSVRQAFDLLASHLGPRAGWVLTGSVEFRTVGFHNRQISSQPQENSEKSPTQLE